MNNGNKKKEKKRVSKVCTYINAAHQIAAAMMWNWQHHKRKWNFF